MSDDGLSKKEQEALQQTAQVVQQQLAEGRSAEDVARDLEANGWFRNDAVEFVAQMERQWQEMAESPEAQSDFYFQSRFPEMRPIRSAPELATINGFGASLSGARDHDAESGTYVKTHSVCLLFIPVFALGAYRVAKADSGGGWHLIGKVPLSTFAKTWNRLVMIAGVALVGCGVWAAYTSSDTYRAQRKLNRADEAAASGDLVTASRLYGEVATTRTEHASTARRNLEQLLERPELAELPVARVVNIFRCAADIRDMPRAFELGLALVKKHVETAPVDSARLLRTIARLSPDEAREELAELLDGPLGNLSAEDTVSVLRTVAEMSQEPAHHESLLAWGMNWLEEHPQADPRGTLALLDLLEESPTADLASLDTARLRQWERIVAEEPDSVEAAVQLALLLENGWLENGDDADRIETLLTSHRDKLGTGEGARLLGQLLAAKGEFDESYALLGPYMEERLAELHVAQDAFEESIVRAHERAIASLQTGTASGFNYTAYDNATEDRQLTMVDDYVALQAKDNGGIAAARERLIRHAAIVPVALDLGMVTLRRAENMTDADARRTELQKAEETFLAIQNMAGDTDAYRLHLGQVYYWLGKHEEGHGLFEELLTDHDRGYDILMGVADVLRDLGVPVPFTLFEPE